jgi:hypothetical protein
MTDAISTALTAADASVLRGGGLMEQAEAHGRYVVECIGADGEVKWREEIENLVTTAGKNDALDKYLSGSAYTAAWFLGLVDGATTPTYAAADTAASHAGWTENTAYSNATRPAPTFNAAASGAKATTGTAFSINANGQTIAGVFLISNSTKAGTTGVLYSVGAFTGGNKAVGSGDTLNVTWTGSL